MCQDSSFNAAAVGKPATSDTHQDVPAEGSIIPAVQRDLESSKSACELTNSVSASALHTEHLSRERYHCLTSEATEYLDEAAQRLHAIAVRALHLEANPQALVSEAQSSVDLIYYAISFCSEIGTASNLNSDFAEDVLDLRQMLIFRYECNLITYNFLEVVLEEKQTLLDEERVDLVLWSYAQAIKHLRNVPLIRSGA